MLIPSFTQISQLLMHAGEKAMRMGQYPKAYDVFRLAGKWENVLRLLHEQLSVYLTAYDEEPVDRTKWREVAAEFYTMYLDVSARNQSVRLALQQAAQANRFGSQSNGSHTTVEEVKNGFVMMLKLYEFFDLCKRQQWDTAVAKVFEMNEPADTALLPRNEQEVPVCVSNVQRFMFRSVSK